jgi:hypothetical protein
MTIKSNRRAHMIRITIGLAERELKEADESWVNQQINLRRKDEQPVTVKVTFNVENLHFTLSTPTFNGGGSGDWHPNPQEKAVIDLWNERGLSKKNFTGGNVVAFLKQLKKLL